MAMPLQWRTASVGGVATSARVPHLGRPASRASVRVFASSSSFLNPHSILGVSAAADVKEVKRAYRKLALQYHPDVCKSEDGHERFMALTQAYEMLLGRAEGKTDPGHASSSGWDFHDWYWNFKMQRSWERQTRQAKAAAASAAAAAAEAGPDTTGTEEAASSDTAASEAGEEDGGDSCGRRPPPASGAGYKQTEGRANLRSQLAGLRHRAAVRANRPASAPPSPTSASASSPSASAASGTSYDMGDVAAPELQHQQASRAPAAAAATGSAASADQEASSAASAFGDGSSSANKVWSWTWSWIDTIDESDAEDQQGHTAAGAAAAATASTASVAAADAAAGADAAASEAAADLHSQFTHVYNAAGGKGDDGQFMSVQDGAMGTVVANHAVPFPGTHSPISAASASAQQRPRSHRLAYDYDFDQEYAASRGRLDASGEWEDEEEEQHSNGHEEEEEPASPFSNVYEKAQGQPQYQQARRKFAADSAARESVSHQLAGLRRKAAMKVAAGL